MRQLDWPPEYNERALRNRFVDRWHGHEAELVAALPDTLKTYERAVAAEDFEAAAILIGESIGLVDAVRPAADIVAGIASQAARILETANSFIEEG